MPEFITQPWSWYVSGALIGLTVPALLLLGNKHFGISSSLRHICAACFPGKVPFFNYNWKREAWNLFFVAGIVAGAALAVNFFSNHQPVQVAPQTVQALSALGVATDGNLVPHSIFNFSNVFTLKGLVFFVVGGFLVGFGTRYAGGCTSGHSIMGLSTLQWPSLVATVCFMAGGFAVVHLVFPWLFKII
ncbi:MAG: YeeE/YedE family protein [Cytophagales bacterium]|nr:YeeE/YedE family protein [Cytophagales bacterium]